MLPDIMPTFPEVVEWWREVHTLYHLPTYDENLYVLFLFNGVMVFMSRMELSSEGQSESSPQGNLIKHTVFW